VPALVGKLRRPAEVLVTARIGLKYQDAQATDFPYLGIGCGG
jgi:hypothetical protein